MWRLNDARHDLPKPTQAALDTTAAVGATPQPAAAADSDLTCDSGSEYTFLRLDPTHGFLTGTPNKPSAAVKDNGMVAGWYQAFYACRNYVDLWINGDCAADPPTCTYVRSLQDRQTGRFPSGGASDHVARANSTYVGWYQAWGHLY